MTVPPSPLFESESHTVWRFTGPLLKSHHYVVHDVSKDVLFAVDSGFGPSESVSLVEYLGRKVVGIYLTHGHFDHAGGAKHFSKALECPIMMHYRDLSTLRKSNFLLKVLGYEHSMQIPEVIAVDSNYADEHVALLDCPGHTPGSVLVKAGDLVFTGDSVFADTIDLIKLPQQSDDDLRSSLMTHLNTLKLSTRLFPGHGSDICGNELLLKNRPLVEFLDMAETI